MPTIVVLDGFKIQIFADDHNPPHFHIATPDHEALVRISDLTVIAGRIDRKALALALEWASIGENRERLINEWNRLNER